MECSPFAHFVTEVISSSLVQPGRASRYRRQMEVSGVMLKLSRMSHEPELKQLLQMAVVVIRDIRCWWWPAFGQGATSAELR
ncbi:hypothetical protein GCM10009610_00650 [Pseudonocardia xinjiangensis]